MEGDFDAATLLALPAPVTRAELLERIAVARALLDQEFAGDRPDLARRDAAGWTALDHLRHIAVWEDLIVAHLRDGDEHRLVGLDRAAFDALDLEGLNVHIHARTRGHTPDQARQHARLAHAAIRALIPELPEATFGQPYWSDEPNGRTVMEKITGDTYRHYLEHLTWIRALRARP
jgi:hypothetical protein